MQQITAGVVVLTHFSFFRFVHIFGLRLVVIGGGLDSWFTLIMDYDNNIFKIKKHAFPFGLTRFDLLIRCLEVLLLKSVEKILNYTKKQT